MIVFLSILAGCTGAPVRSATVSGNLVITNGTVIDGTGADPIRDGVVVITGDRIAAVGTAADFVLPPDITQVGAQGRLDVHAVLEPAKEVGGDLYEVLQTEDGKLVFVLGDVSGKGVPAALFMAVTMTLVRTLARTAADPGSLLRQVNDALAAQNPRNMFVTVLCALFDPQSHELTYASAGHPPAVHIRGDRAEFLSLKPEMMFL